MGDISELRALVTVISFTATLIFLIGLMPPQFYQMDYEGRTVTPEDYWEVGGIQAFNETWTYHMNETGGSGTSTHYYVEIENDGEWFGGHDLTFWYAKANQSVLNLDIVHHFSWWGILPDTHLMHWLNYQGENYGEYLWETELDGDYPESISYTVKCSHFYMKAFFYFNETLYSSPSQAWDHHGLWILLGINFDQMATGFNAFNLIGMLLFFQLPMVHWIINAVIAVPIWVCIMYLSFIFILRALGAIFGGGGA